MYTEQVLHDNISQPLQETRSKFRSAAFTLVETIISMTLIAVIFLLITQAFSSLLLGSYLTDARTTVRNEGEFVGEYLKLRIKNADPRTLTCSNGANKYISWQSKGSTDYNYFFLNGTRFCFSKRSIDDCDTVLTYNDVIVKNVKINCDSPEFNETPVANMNISFMLDSAAQLGTQPAVRNVSRFVSTSIR